MAPQDVAATFRSPQDAPTATNASFGDWRRKSNRLAAQNYVGNAAYSLAMVTQGRARRFTDEAVVRYCEAELLRSASQRQFDVLAYVFMSDHLHLLIKATSDESRLSEFAKLYKQKTAFWFKRQVGLDLWQKSYYDHVLRSDEDVEAAALYIAANPFRAGLVEDWPKYPYLGGKLLRLAAGEEVPGFSDGPSFGDLKVAATDSGAS